MSENFRESRDFFRRAVFFLITPLFLALSASLNSFFKPSSMAFAFLLSRSFLNCFSQLLKVFKTLLLAWAFFLDERILFSADL